MVDNVEHLRQQLDRLPVDLTMWLALADAMAERGEDGRGYQALAIGRYAPWTTAGRFCWFDHQRTHDLRSEDLPHFWFVHLKAYSPIRLSFGLWYDTLSDAVTDAATAFLKLYPSDQNRLLCSRGRRLPLSPNSTLCATSVG